MVPGFQLSDEEQDRLRKVKAKLAKLERQLAGASDDAEVDDLLHHLRGLSAKHAGLFRRAGEPLPAYDDPRARRTGHP